MVYSYDYFYQNSLFYSSCWSKDTEITFVNALIEHKRAGNFHRDGNNCRAVLCMLYDVHKVHGRKVQYDVGQKKVKKLKERHATFSWIINLPGVVVNHERRYVVAEDHIWEIICKARVLGKCYVNMYEDMLEEMCVLLAPDRPIEGLGDGTEEVDPLDDFVMMLE
ncbi:hypothetical protein Salat_2126300 [Sesamum alatum]|uniref:Myb/SANT-like domain-containing protein n=1 Tax=Sesamum alatum TaxID=300844 RepID=A0AAE2CH00_9LAMI|nr:hypothetical protein Salat_2126300 [Sesamum alatum]